MTSYNSLVRHNFLGDLIDDIGFSTNKKLQTLWFYKQYSRKKFNIKTNKKSESKSKFQ
jgi:hypothetical protein